MSAQDKYKHNSGCAGSLIGDRCGALHQPAWLLLIFLGTEKRRSDLATRNAGDA
jgi:hypothetical protein